MAVILTCHKCGESYCRNEGPQDLHVCKTLEQTAFEHEQEMERQFAAVARMDLQQYASNLEAEISRLKDRINELEEGMRDAVGMAQGLWDGVGNHPASQYAKDVEYYKSVLKGKS